jgi:RadC-like JAB domain-containing protein
MTIQGSPLYEIDPQLGDLEREVFCCLFLDNRHRVIAFEKLFLGTIDGTSVHAREVVKAALKCNAAAVIFAHNLTKRLRGNSRTPLRLWVSECSTISLWPGRTQ